MLLQAEDGMGGEALRLWEWPHLGVVLGAGGQIAVDVNEAECQADDVPLARRASGGGTVLLGSSCQLYSLVLRYDRRPELRDVTASYRWIMGQMKTILRAIHPDIEVAGISDLCILGRKFSGNAQQRKRHYLLHHGTLLYNFDLPAISRYLRMPEKQPEYRQGRSHLEFVGNLPTTADTLKELLAGGWSASGELPLPMLRMEELLQQKYLLDSWVRRR